MHQGLAVHRCAAGANRALNIWKNTDAAKGRVSLCSGCSCIGCLSLSPEGGGLHPRPFEAACDDRAVDILQGTQRIRAFRGVLFRLRQFLADREELRLQDAFGLLIQFVGGDETHDFSPVRRGRNHHDLSCPETGAG